MKIKFLKDVKKWAANKFTVCKGKICLNVIVVGKVTANFVSLSRKINLARNVSYFNDLRFILFILLIYSYFICQK